MFKSIWLLLDFQMRIQGDYFINTLNYISIFLLTGLDAQHNRAGKQDIRLQFNDR